MVRSCRGGSVGLVAEGGPGDASGSAARLRCIQPTFGARAEAAPISPPTARRMTYFGGSLDGGGPMMNVDVKEVCTVAVGGGLGGRGQYGGRRGCVV